ncbi:peptidylprolyl isomerase [Candidatus Pelagibacter sp.]|nr:peptidylprolyl isomerase [Candidatus Pelagibacter sp.]
MLRKVFLFSLIIFFQFTLTNITFSKVNIIVLVNNEIITSYDLKKESNYLKILNPKLEKLEKNQITKLAKQSLIKEIIKKNELSKLIDLKEKNSFADQYFKDILLRLGYKNEIEFNNNLIKHSSYTLEEVKFKSKIEIYWNDLIFNKYNNELNIDIEKLKKKVDEINIDDEKEIFLSEIVLIKKKNNSDNKNLIKKIKASIKEIGFDNTATMYSITDSSKFGGKIGWIKKKGLSKKIYEKIKNLEINEVSDAIEIKNNLIFLKIDDVKDIKKIIDKDKELQKLISIEKNKKLEDYSRLYFNRVKANYFINEK